MVCQEVDTFLAEVSGGGGWVRIPIPSAEGVGDLVGSGSVCLLPTAVGSTDLDPTTPMGPMAFPLISIKDSRT